MLKLRSTMFSSCLAVIALIAMAPAAISVSADPPVMLVAARTGCSSFIICRHHSISGHVPPLTFSALVINPGSNPTYWVRAKFVGVKDGEPFIVVTSSVQMSGGASAWLTYAWYPTLDDIGVYLLEAYAEYSSNQITWLVGSGVRDISFIILP